jgi:hypothetical protein
MMIAGILVWLLIILISLETMGYLNVNSFFSKETSMQDDVRKGVLDRLHHVKTPVYLRSVEIVDEVGAKGQTITTVTITSGTGTINPLLAFVLISVTFLYIIAIVIKVCRGNRRSTPGDGFSSADD